VRPQEAMTARHLMDRLRFRIGTASLHCILAASFLLLGGCAGDRETPGVPWLLGATVRSLAGAPPTPPDFYAEPVRVSDTLKFAAITAGADHTCALTMDGDTYCWGSSQYRQLGSAALTETCGNGTFACSSSPVRLEGAPRFTAVTAAIGGTCGLDASGAAHCWGFGLGGRQGNPLGANSGMPVEVPGGHTFSALTSNPAGNRICGLGADGRAWCWGLSHGSSGGGQTRVFAGPDPVATSLRFVSISFGAEHGCGVDVARDAYCWGSNQLGQLGVGASALDGGIRESSAPVPVGGRLKLARIVAAPGYNCGLDTEGSLYCWGLGFPVDDGSAARSPRGFPAHGALPISLEAAGEKWGALGANTNQLCGLSIDGALYCSATTPNLHVSDRRRRAIRVASDQAFAAFAMGGSHACAIGADGFAYCWGSSHVGQVGRSPKGR
jgi:alpha-tubulin suppressor-like RCC1 family protein